jgi:hypothetical protein
VKPDEGGEAVVAAAAPVQRSAITASAKRLDITDRKVAEGLRDRRERQARAWDYFDTLGPIKYAGRFYGNALARVRLYVGVRPDSESDPVAVAAAAEWNPDNDEPPPIPLALAIAAEEELARIRDERGGTASLRKAHGINMFVAGECYLVGEPADESVDPPLPERWSVRSVDEMTSDDGHAAVQETAKGKPRRLPDNAVVVRVWEEHPRYKGEPDSSVMGVLDDCEELATLRTMVRTTARSRMNNGILFVAQEFSFGPADVTKDGAPGQEGDGDPLTEAIMDAITAPIEDEASASSVAPIVIRGPAALADALKKIDLARPVDKDLVAQRDKAVESLATGLDLPVEILTGKADLNHWCVDEDTEALTHRGWVRHDALEVGDEVLTLNHTTGLAEWAPVDDVYRAPVVGERMVKIDGRDHVSVTTPNHRWPVLAGGVRGWRLTETLREGDRLLTAAPADDLPADPKWSDDFVELLAWFWTEGSEQGGAVTIAQSHTRNPERVARIDGALTRLFGAAHDTLRGSQGPAWRRSVQVNATSYGGPVTIFHLNRAASELFTGRKVVPLDVVRQMTRAQLALFVDVSLQGDGQHYRAGRLDCWQRDGRRLDALELAGVLLGYTVRRRAADGGERLTLTRKATVRPVKSARQRARGKGGSTRITDVSYTGVVWCPVTRNATWLARRSGTVYYTGNTSWQVDEDTYKAHIEPALLVLVEAWTAAVLRPALLARDEKFDPEQVARIEVWGDPSALVAGPDAADAANDGWDRGLLSDKAWRKAKRYDEGDAPDEEELADRIASGRVKLGAPLAPPLTPGAPAGGPEGAEPPPGTQARRLAAAPDVMTAAAGRSLRRLSADLTARERTLRDRLVAGADAALRQALSVAGKRAKSRVASAGQDGRRNGPAYQAVRDVRPELVCATLGRSIVAAAGLTDDDLLTDAFAEFGEQFATWTAAAQDDALAAVDRALGSNPARRAAAEARQAAGRDEAWQWLRAALVSRAAAALYDPHPNAALEQGEGDPDLTVPVGTVRAALRRAGGAGQGTSGGVDDRGLPLLPGEAIALGALLGPALLEPMAEEDGVEVEGYTWTYGVSRRPFEPHLELDGLVVASPDDDRLANPDSFPPHPFYVPGDHDGCNCDLTPTFIQRERPSYPFSRSGEPLDEAVAASA